MIKGTLSRKFRKEKDMTKHILTKHILAALTMAAMVPIGQAWAEPSFTIDEATKALTVDTNSTVTADATFGGHPLNSFSKVTVIYSPTGDAGGNRAMGIYSAEYDLSNTDIVVNVKNTGYSNNDGLHLTNHFPSYAVRSYNATIEADNSDALNLSHDITSNNKQDSMVVIGNSSDPIGTNGNGDLTAVVLNGNGIRANASIKADIINGITILGKTDITLKGGPVTTSSSTSISKTIGPFTVSAGNVSTEYAPAAVYAGDDMYSLSISDSYSLGDKAVGQGIIHLQGDTKLNLLGNSNYGIYTGKNGTIDANNIDIYSTGKDSFGIAAKNSNLIFGGKVELQDVKVSMDLGWTDIPLISIEQMPLYNADDSANTYGSTVTLNGDANVITMKGDNSYAIYAEGVDANGESNTVQSGDNGIGSFEITGDIAAENGGNITLDVNKGSSLTGTVFATGKGSVEVNEELIEQQSTAKLHMKDTFSMTGDAAAKDGGIIELTSGKWSGLTGSLMADGTGSSVAFSTDQIFDMTGDASATTGGKVALTSGSYGSLFGAMTASGEKSQASMTSEGVNYVDSETVISGAGGLGTDAPKINSALYAEDSGQIDLGGSFNYIAAGYSGEGSESYSRRAVWAYNAADINITGGVQIAADDSAQDDPAGKNSTNMAIVAGTSTNVTSENVNNKISDRATVTVNYDSYADSDGNTVASSIKGDIVSAYAGQVDIRKKDDEAKNAKINIKGNLLAGNNGILNVDLGNGGTLEGRADDYGDAGLKTEGETIDEGHAGAEFFDPAFSSTIYKGGRVDLTMGEGSRWNVTGQSWITSVTTNGNAVIDLTGAGQERNEGADALTIYNMAGGATFLMHLDGDRTGSDMLYMKSADGSYTIYLDEAVDESDIKGSHNELDFDNLRFATVGNGSNADFSVKYVGGGIYDINYQVGSEGYASESEKDKEKNNVYNGTELGEMKPGTGMVEDFFTQAGRPPEAETGGASGASVLAAEEEPEDADDIGARNYYISGAEKTVNDTGKTIIAMSKVNYSNAVYMDRLNKRMGEARYIDGDDGLWVRMRHDRIGKEDAFRSMNTMFEIGYDWKDNAQKDGTHYRGVAFDYMRGTADYTNVLGEGDVRRAGLWYHDTWMGDKGHYTDYVVKYGRLSNDFDIYGRTTGEKISGDYDNDVWSVSAEYGRKKDIGNDWYFEPQVQAQYAYVTSADYTTSQGTKVSLDSIDSLIGRAGFRLGRDTDEANTVYFKADILHEFLGGQSIRAMDSTGTLSTTYENEGTWYDVGFGFSHRMSKDKYMFLDVEKLFGNDNEDTYQVNIGLNMAF